MIGISSSLFTTRLPKTITNKRYHLSVDYVESVTKAGAISCMLPILKPEDAQLVVSQISGLILSGGNDISRHLAEHSAEIGESAQEGILLERDLYELALCKEALKQKKPILGVCRGAQLLNVLLGGTLHQEIENTTEIAHIQKKRPEIGSHFIKIDRKSDLYSIVGKSEIMVNSYHHQAIKKVGQRLKVSALSEDGYIEAIEYTGESFAMGLQWHPEIMASHNEENASKIFSYFIKQVELQRIEKKAI